MANDELEVDSSDNFVAEAAVMDLSPIKGETFIVAVSAGKEDGVRVISRTIHGPYDFVGMVEQVGEMWRREQHHARAIILNKDPSVPVKALDPNTIDYIEAHYEDILVEEALMNAPDDRVFTHVAGTTAGQEEE